MHFIESILLGAQGAYHVDKAGPKVTLNSNPRYMVIEISTLFVLYFMLVFFLSITSSPRIWNLESGPEDLR